MEKLSSYEKMLSQSGEERDKLDRQYQVEDALGQLNADIQETERALTRASREVPDLILAVPFSPASILNKRAEIASLEKGVKKLKELKSELFPDAK